ncbi:MAG: hypothetical protein HOP23_03890 [Methylococcaceae bacterium]|nr:hypothetical protein [Methylococcaceae bacterium]
MKSTHTNPYSTHHDISLLLPWYVNNTLRSAELKDVENHLKVCLTCKRELATLKKISLAVNQEGPFDSAALASFSHLKNRIHNTAIPTEPSAQVISLPKRRWQQLAFKAPIFSQSRLALAAAIVLALIIPGHLDLGKLSNNDYRTLSNSDIASSRKNDIRVVFANNITPQQIDTILSSIHGQIAGGPTEQSVYTVRITQAATKKNILETVAQLRKNSSIIFAEPAYELLSSPDGERS